LPVLILSISICEDIFILRIYIAVTSPYPQDPGVTDCTITGQVATSINSDDDCTQL